MDPTGLEDSFRRKKPVKNLVNTRKKYLQSKIFYAILTKLFTWEHEEQENRGVTVGHVLIIKSEVNIMREGIHPNYYQAKVVCNCGNEFVTGSTKKDIHVEICSKCHSFYTGQQKAASARGRIEMFNRKYGVK